MIFISQISEKSCTYGITTFWFSICDFPLMRVLTSPKMRISRGPPVYDYLRLGSIPVYMQKCTLFEMWLVLGSLCPISLLLFFGDVFFSRNLRWKIIMNSSVFVSVANSFFLNTRYAFDDINRARLPYKWHFFFIRF